MVSSTIAQLCPISGVVKVGSGQFYHRSTLPYFRSCQGRQWSVQFYHPSTLPYFRSCQGRQWSVLPSLNFALFQELSRSAVVSYTITQLCLISGVVKVGSGQFYHRSTLPYFRSCQGRQWSVLPSLNFALFQELSRSAVVSSTITQLCPISGVVKVGSGQLSSTIPQLCLSSRVLRSAVASSTTSQLCLISGVVKVGSGQLSSTIPQLCLSSRVLRSAVASSTTSQLCLISGVVKVGSGQFYHR